MSQLETALKGDLQAPINSLECQEFKRTHENCIGCVHQTDCKEFVKRFFEYLVVAQREAGVLSENDSEYFLRGISE